MGKVIKLTFLGDLMCQREQIAAVRKAGCGYDVVFEQVRHLWADSDYVVGNLETPVAGRKLRYAYETMRFNAPEAFAAAIKGAGVDFLSTANNHMLDRGVAGLEMTLHNLDVEAIDHDGSFKTQEASEKVFVREVGGVRIAFVACTYGTNQGLKCNFLPDDQLWRVTILKYPEQVTTTRAFLIRRFFSNLIPVGLKERIRVALGRKPVQAYNADSAALEDFDKPENEVFLAKVLGKVRRAKASADLVVVLPHIGGQYNSVPGPWQLKVTDALVEAGADLVISNHAHTALHAESRGGAFCAHALGNFCFTPHVGFYNDRCQADYSIVLHCFVDSVTRKLVKKTFSVVKSVVREDGVSVVCPVNDSDAVDVDIVCRRVSGRKEKFDVRKEYEL